MSTFNRRTLLRGMLGGSAIAVGLPLLDCFLDSNGEALADGSALPKTFVSWFQGLGFQPGFWEPKTVGANYTFGRELRALQPIRDKVNVISGLKVYVDSHAANAHVSGPQGCLQGGLEHPNLPTIDQIVADSIGTRTRYRSLEVSCHGSEESYSRRSATAINAGQPNPAALYADIFGGGFKDPNAAEFTPDPWTMARASVLSAVKDDRETYMKRVGAADRARLEEYFTSLRSMENNLQVQLEKPAPLPSCSNPKGMDFHPTQGLLIDEVRGNHRLFAKLLAHAMSCGQTNVAHLNLAGSNSNIRRAGMQQTFHMYTHEEPNDPTLGYQIEVEWFSNQVAETLLEFVQAFEAVKEGKGTLLDRSLILYSTDTGYSRTHSLQGFPFMTIGGASGALKTGIHVHAPGDAVTRVGLTVMQAMGVPIGSWGVESNTTSKTITEIMA